MKATHSMMFNLDLETEAQRIQSVAIDTVRTSQTHVQAEWYHSENALDLFLWHDPQNKLIKFQLGWLGQIVEWNPLDGLKTAMVIEEEWSTPKSLIRETLRYDEVPQAELINQALRVVNALPQAFDSRRHLLREPIENYAHPQTHSLARRFWQMVQSVWFRLFNR